MLEGNSLQKPGPKDLRTCPRRSTSHGLRLMFGSDDPLLGSLVHPEIVVGATEAATAEEPEVRGHIPPSAESAGGGRNVSSGRGTPNAPKYWRHRPCSRPRATHLNPEMGQSWLLQSRRKSRSGWIADLRSLLGRIGEFDLGRRTHWDGCEAPVLQAEGWNKSLPARQP